MRFENRGGDGFAMMASDHEFSVINGCMNLALDAFYGKKEEFSIRVAASHDEVERMIDWMIAERWRVRMMDSAEYDASTVRGINEDELDILRAMVEFGDYPGRDRLEEQLRGVSVHGCSPRLVTLAVSQDAPGGCSGRTSASAWSRFHA
jgi:hypothetical protein